MPSPASAPALLELVHASVERGGRRILSDLTVSFGPGLTAVLGRSGAGKTSLLRLCNGLDVADHGAVRFRGRDIGTIDPRRHRRRVALIFQRPVMFAGTVFDNLRVADDGLGPDAARSLVLDMGLEPAVVDRRADTLSGGEAQRVALARGLATGPDVVLADEVTASLDRESATVIEARLRALADAGRAVVLVTHDGAAACRLADFIVVLVDGRVAAVGDPREIAAHPDPAVRSALSEGPQR